MKCSFSSYTTRGLNNQSNNNLSNNSLYFRSLLAIKTASDSNKGLNSTNPFLIKVDPLLTKSQIISANPILGATSTEPEIS